MLKSILNVQNFVLYCLIIKIIIGSGSNLKDYLLIKKYENAILKI